MFVYKIFRAHEFQAFEEAGRSDGAPIDLEDGYIHLSTSDQVPGTLEKHFDSETGLRLLAIEERRLGRALKWEPSRGGSLFPHLYRTLKARDVAWSAHIPYYNGRHLVPTAPG
ncbi:MAG: DUF952 domain-containing protein [Pseudomonadota bacterium]